MGHNCETSSSSRQFDRRDIRSSRDVIADHDESPRGGAEPLSSAARRQPGRLVPVGRGGVRPSAHGGQADLSLDRLFDVPLVSRDGARVVREPGDCRRPEQRLRLDQGRSRRAARRRSRLHDVRPGDDRVGRLADERVADARAASRFTAARTTRRRRSGAGPGSARCCSRSRAPGARSARSCCSRRAKSPSGSREIGRSEADEHAAVDGCRATTRWRSTVRQFQSTFDARRGGFGDAPKFPRPSELLFLLREHARTGDEAPGDMVLTTLRAMALGGMRDHIGGGFHRYSVDGNWRVPALREDALRPGATGARVPRSRRRRRAIRSSRRSPRTRCSTSSAR